MSYQSKTDPAKKKSSLSTGDNLTTLLRLLKNTSRRRNKDLNAFFISKGYKTQGNLNTLKKKARAKN